MLIEVVKTHCLSIQELDISTCHASGEQEADLKACLQASKSLAHLLHKAKCSSDGSTALQGRSPAPVAEQPAVEPVRPPPKDLTDSAPEDLTDSATVMKPIGAWPDRSP